MPIRITYVIPTLDQSGAERQLTLLATGLPREEFQPHVIALNREGYYADALRDAGISVDVLGKRFRFDPLTYLRLRRNLRRNSPEIVQSFLFAANSYVRFPGVCPAKAKIVVSERCVDSWKSGWQLKMDRRLMGRMNAMTANSESVAKFYRTMVGVPEKEIVVIPNGMPPETVGNKDAGSGQGNLREELGLAPETKLVGFVGRLASQKCLSDLVWAFQLLHQTVANVRLVIVGEGPERQQLAELARSFDCRDKVFFLGHRNDATAVIRELNVFCLPSSFEGMSNSLMEAMQAAVPVVVSDIDANLQLINHEQNGLVVPLNNGPAITAACKRILEDTDFAQSLGEAAAEKIRLQFSVDQMVQRHVDLYRRLVGQAV